MNVYPCSYNGNLGYSCRLNGHKWMFVPALAQPDSKVYRNISLGDLAFRNPFAQRFEESRERRMRESKLRNWLKSLLMLDRRPQTLGGRLFTVH